MPEGDTIHRVARRFEAALVGKEIARGRCPNGTLAAAPARVGARRANARVRRGVRQAPAAELLRRPGRPQPSRDERSLVRSRRRSAELRKALAGARRRAGDREPERRQDPADDQRRARPQRSGAAAARAPTRCDPATTRRRPPRACSPTSRRSPSARPCSTRRLIAGIGNVIRIEACFIPGRQPMAAGRRADSRRGRRDRRREQLGDGDVARDRTPAEADLRPRPPSLREVRRPDHDPWAG